jgi:predicted short-subunit dehydrogenase-like oxidoreductase (DUF2520 family)
MQSSKEKIRFAIVGSGNVATRLVDAFASVGQKPDFLLSNSINGRQLADKFNVNLIHQPDVEVDIWLLCVKDDAINAELGKHFPAGSLVCHTAGSVSMDVLKRNSKTGVFYPLQSLSKDKKVDFSNIPICIEAQSESDLLLLENLGSLISNDVRRLNAEQRRTAHLAAVFVSNFVNYCYRIGYDLLKAEDVDFSILQPLILETAEKAFFLNPHLSQTGPAQRGDQTIIQKHIELLESWPDYQNIYKLISNAIENGRH